MNVINIKLIICNKIKMKISNKDLSSLADTTKATTTKIGDINEENVIIFS